MHIVMVLVHYQQSHRRIVSSSVGGAVNRRLAVLIRYPCDCDTGPP